MSNAAKNSPTVNKWEEVPKYFVHDYSKISLVETYQVALKGAKRHDLAVLAVIIRMVKRALGRPLRDGPPFQPSGPKFIELRAIPAEVAAIQEPFVKPLADAGFTPILASKTTSQHGSGYGLFMRSNDGLSVASITFVQVGSKEMHQQKRTVTIAGLQVASRRTNGSSLVTTNAAPGFRLPDDIKILYLKRASPEEVITQHRRRIADLTDIEFTGRDDVRTRVEQRYRRLVELQIGRGFYAPATEEEMRRHGLSTTAADAGAPN